MSAWYVVALDKHVSYELIALLDAEMIASEFQMTLHHF